MGCLNASGDICNAQGDIKSLKAPKVKKQDGSDIDLQVTEGSANSYKIEDFNPTLKYITTTQKGSATTPDGNGNFTYNAPLLSEGVTQDTDVMSVYYTHANLQSNQATFNFTVIPAEYLPGCLRFDLDPNDLPTKYVAEYIGGLSDTSSVMHIFGFDKDRNIYYAAFNPYTLIAIYRYNLDTKQETQLLSFELSLGIGSAAYNPEKNEIYYPHMVSAGVIEINTYNVDTGETTSVSKDHSDYLTYCPTGCNQVGINLDSNGNKVLLMPKNYNSSWFIATIDDEVNFTNVYEIPSSGTYDWKWGYTFQNRIYAGRAYVDPCIHYFDLSSGIQKSSDMFTTLASDLGKTHARWSLLFSKNGYALALMDYDWDTSTAPGVFFLDFENETYQIIPVYDEDGNKVDAIGASFLNTFCVPSETDGSFYVIPRGGLSSHAIYKLTPQ